MEWRGYAMHYGMNVFGFLFLIVDYKSISDNKKQSTCTECPYLQLVICVCCENFKAAHTHINCIMLLSKNEQTTLYRFFSLFSCAPVGSGRFYTQIVTTFRNIKREKL